MHRPEAVPQGHHRSLPELRVLVVAALEPVVGDPGAQVVDVVQADVRGEPLEDLRELQEGRAEEGGVVVVPVLLPVPVGVLELVLHVEQPHPEGARQQGDRELDHQEGHDADCEPRPGQNPGEGRVGPPHGLPLALPGAGHVPREPVLDEEVERGAGTEEHHRVAVESVSDSLHPGHRLVLPHRDRDDVAEGARVQVPRVRVVDRVRPAPVVVRREREHADHRTRDAGQPAGLEVRPVPAVVLEHEEPHEQARGGDGQDEGEPVSHGQAPVHQSPRAGEEDGGVSHLPGAAAGVRAEVGGQNPLPLANLFAVGSHLSLPGLSVGVDRRRSGTPKG